MEILLVGGLVGGLIAFNEPLSRWLGGYMADAFERTITASPDASP